MTTSVAHADILRTKQSEQIINHLTSVFARANYTTRTLLVIRHCVSSLDVVLFVPPPPGIDFSVSAALIAIRRHRWRRHYIQLESSFFYLVANSVPPSRRRHSRSGGGGGPVGRTAKVNTESTLTAGPHVGDTCMFNAYFVHAPDVRIGPRNPVVCFTLNPVHGRVIIQQHARSRAHTYAYNIIIRYRTS